MNSNDKNAERLASLENKLAGINNIVDYLDSKIEKRLQLSVKQTELETKRLEAKYKMDKKDKVICFLALLLCFVASLVFAWGLYCVHEHFDFLKSALVETTSINHTVDVQDINSSENIGNVTLEK